MGMVVLFGVASLIYDHIFGLSMFAAGILLLAVFYIFFIKKKIDKARAVALAITEMKQKNRFGATEDMPSVMTDKNDNIFWYNNAFLSLAGKDPEGKNLYEVMPVLLRPSKDKTVMIDGVSYTKDTCSVKEGDEDFTVYSLTDN